jgi:CARDB
VETEENNNNMQIRKIIGLMAAFTFVVTIIFGLYFSQVSAEKPQLYVEKPLAETGAVAPSCRYGVASFRELDNPFIEELNAGWAVDFIVNFNRTWPNGVAYAPIIRMKQDKDPDTGARLPTYTISTPQLNDDPGGLGPLITANPGLLWLVGNEVDRVYWQDDMMPDVYADAYYDIYNFIKARDPSALVAISGLVEVTPGRLQYLDMVWDSYLEKYGTPIPVDVWNMHVYILPEIKADGSGSSAAVALGTDPALAILESGNNPALCPQDDVYCYAEHDDTSIFRDQIVAMRQWMKDRGLQDKPLILSEFSILYPYDGQNPCFLMDEYGGCFTPTRVTDYMIDTFAILEGETDVNLGYPQDNYRLVQQWLWFAMNDRSEDTPNALVDLDPITEDPINLSVIGQTYKDEVADSNYDVNLIPSMVSHTAVISTTSTTISAEVRNNGGIPAGTSFTISFYADAALTTLIDEVVVPANLAGCAIGGQTVSVTWNGLTPNQVNYFWVKVDSNNVIVESSDADNVASGFVIVDPKQLFLPFTTR